MRFSVVKRRDSRPLFTDPFCRNPRPSVSLVVVHEIVGPNNGVLLLGAIPVIHTKTAPGAWVSLGDLFFCNGSSVSLQDWVLQQQVAVAVN